MDTPRRLALFAAGLAAVLGAGWTVGAAVGPTPVGTEEEPPAPAGDGVVAAFDGYRLVPESATLDPAGGPFRFVVADPSGDPQREFTTLHDKALHLILVNRDLTSFHHVHPALDQGGTWSIDLPPLAAGSYRAIADFQVAGGPRLALGTDLGVGGQYTPATLPAPAARTTVDGYEVTLDTTHHDGGEVTVDLVVRRGDQPVALEPYLGARGHLVAMRAGDLAYAHVHPLEQHGDAAGGTVAFDATLASAGRYALFFDFRAGGRVHTAAFTVDQARVERPTEMEH